MNAARTADGTAVDLRPIRPEDEAFLYQVYASTRDDELAITGWSDEEKRVFLTQQFEAQHAFYQAQFAGSEFLVIEQAGRPIGRLYVGRWDDEIRVIDIALLTEHRGRGIGSRLMREILDEARGAGKPVRIHVEHNNPALRMYERLGFLAIEDQGVYLLMEWRPEGE